MSGLKRQVEKQLSNQTESYRGYHITVFSDDTQFAVMSLGFELGSVA